MLYDFPRPTPMIMVLGTHFTRASDVIVPDFLTVDPACRDHAVSRYVRQLVQPHGRACRPRAPGRRRYRSRQRTAGPGGRFGDSARGRGPARETLVYLLGSRYCETDRLSDIAWHLFAEHAAGLGAGAGDLRFRPHHIAFGYEHARPTKTRWEAYRRGQGRLPRLRPSGHRFLPLHEHPGALLHGLSQRHRHAAAVRPADFAGWFEAYLGGRWHTFDPRNNVPRIGRVLIAQRPRRLRRADHAHLRAQSRWSASRSGPTRCAMMKSSRADLTGGERIAGSA